MNKCSKIKHFSGSIFFQSDINPGIFQLLISDHLKIFYTVGVDNKS